MNITGLPWYFFYDCCIKNLCFRESWFECVARN